MITAELFENQNMKDEYYGVLFKSKTKKALSENTRNLFYEYITHTNAQIESALHQSKETNRKCDSIKQEITTLEKDIAEKLKLNGHLSAMVKETNEEKLNLQDEKLKISLEKAELQKRIAKIEDQLKLLEAKNEEHILKQKEKGRMFVKITGVQWDIKYCTESQVKGYAQNKNTCRLKNFDICKENIQSKEEVADKIFAVIDEISK